jgi:hypothetical protein
MVDDVGPDPFGIGRARNLNECNEQVLNYRGFDFVISHSSPWKEGVGINRSRVKDYLVSSDGFARGLQRYAVAFCKSRFQNNAKVKVNNTEVNIIRHRGTPECLTTEAIALRNESCIASCPIEQPAPIL